MELKEYLLENDLTASEFAAMIGMSYTSIYFYVHKKTRPRKPTARKIEEFTNGLVTVKELRKRNLKQEKHSNEAAH